METQMKHQQEIEASRVGGFGGSDAKLFLNIAKKGGVTNLSATDNYRIAVAMGLAPYKPIPMTEAMANGHRFEEWFSKSLPIEIKREYYIEKKSQPINFDCFAHADFVGVDGDDIFVDELKWRGNTADAITDGLICDTINTYMPQLQWYYMLGAKAVTLILGVGDLDAKKVETHQVSINYDGSMIAELLKGVELLDQAISNGWKPTIKETIAVAETPDIVADAVERLKANLQSIKQLESENEELKAVVAEYLDLSGASSLLGEGITATRIAPTTQKRFDSAKFNKDNLDLYNNYIKEVEVGGSLRLSIK